MGEATRQGERHEEARYGKKRAGSLGSWIRVGHHLGDAADEQAAIGMVQEAVDGGITLFDTCWEMPPRQN